ncbi:TPA: Rrf2 family transcriptional regulator [Candidatus Poribacteria bacterium]|nr:Rrf2 family transcriptional regulator [Candidatus Poribacteria bacterium]
MMKLSTRSRYGVRLMFELALNYGKGSLLLKDIAKRQDISEKYLSKLIIPLKGAGLVNSIRGAHGGYVLAQDPNKISIKEIVDVLEGDISPVECVKNKSICDRSLDCPIRDVWCKLDRQISNTLESISLQDIVKDYQNKEEKTMVYYI